MLLARNCATALWLISWPALHATTIGRVASSCVAHSAVLDASRQIAPGNKCGDSSYAWRRRTSMICGACCVAIAFQRSFGEIEKPGDSMSPLHQRRRRCLGSQALQGRGDRRWPHIVMLVQCIGTINATPDA